MAFHILGPHCREVLGSQVDLKDYDNRETYQPKIKSGTYSHHGWFDLDTVDPDDKIWWQEGIREEGIIIQERLDAFEDSFTTKKWLVKYIPPLFTTEGKPKDGRGRILTLYYMYKAGLTSRWAPCIYYTETDDSTKSQVTDGLKNNFRHDPSFKATRESVVQGCLTLIKTNELALNEVAIRDYLFTDLELQNVFSEDNITKVVNNVLQRGKGGGDPQVRVVVRKQHESCLEKAGHKLTKTKILLCCDSNTYAFRAWCEHILPAIINNRGLVEIILFTNNHVPSEAIKKIKVFDALVKSYHKASYLMVEKTMGCTWDDDRKIPQYKILGVIPQIYGRHDTHYDTHRLVPLSDFDND